MGPVAVVLFVLLIAGVVMYVGRLAARKGGRRQLPPASLPDEPESTGLKMNYDWTVQTLDGEAFSLKETEGRTLFLNFWATWCPPCVAEMPAVQSLYEKTRDLDVAFLLVSEEGPQKARRFVQQRELTVPVYTAPQGVPPELRTGAIPTTYIVSPEGDVVHKHVGAAQWDAEPVVRFLNRLAGSQR
jgi:thiol-disulfide isomerase/thioredoxin